MVAALERGQLDEAPGEERERPLLELVRRLTETPAQTSDADVEALREVGWTDLEIAEAVYVTALFAFFNRVADAFGLADPNYRELEIDPAEFSDTDDESD